MSNQNQTSRGIGFIGLLTIAFIVLKLTSVIAWSWWWVLSPVWAPPSLVSLVIWLCFLVRIIFLFCTRKKYKRYQENLKKGMSGYSAFREAYKKNKQSAPIRESKFQQRLKEIQNRQKHQ